MELTVAEEELFELLLRTPKITVPWARIGYELARSDMTIRHLMRGIRDKLGSRSVRTHTGLGVSLQPHFVGSTRFALCDHPLRTIPTMSQNHRQTVSEFAARSQHPGELPTKQVGA